MGPGSWRAATVAAAVVLLLAIGASVGSVSADVPLSIAVDGNHFVDGNGQTVRLLGVDQPSSEYACQQGWGYAASDDAADAAEIAAWHANAVRIPINEDCWLGINGEPSGKGLTQAGYQYAIESYVADLNTDGIYAILDLHWSAPGTVKADGQRPMPDDHSVAFWTSVAGTFIANHAVVFDAFNEPFSPAANTTVYKNYPVSWPCWEKGGCTVPDVADTATPDPSKTYTAVGMQALVTAIRATGATQPIMLGGLSYANDLSGWIAHEPSDPLAQLAASFHNYQGEPTCAVISCWNAVIAPIAAAVPVVTGEFDEDTCPAKTPDNFDDSFMNWADANGVSYLAWGWWVLSPLPDCSNYYLITGSDGTPAAPNGTALHDHLAALAGQTGGGPPTTTTTSATTPTLPTTTTSTTAEPPPPGGGSQALRRQIQASLAALLKFERSRSLSDLLRGSGLRAWFHAPLAGSLTIRWWVRRKGRTIVVVTGTRSFARGGTTNVQLHLTTAGRRLLKRRHRVRLRVQTGFTPDGGPIEIDTSTLRL